MLFEGVRIPLRQKNGAIAPFFVLSIFQKGNLVIGIFFVVCLWIINNVFEWHFETVIVFHIRHVNGLGRAIYPSDSTTTFFAAAFHTYV